jgi:hypothetical protein
MGKVEKLVEKKYISVSRWKGGWAQSVAKRAAKNTQNKKVTKNSFFFSSPFCALT